jgi:sporulation-control protein
VFRKLLSSIGIGGAKVDTRLAAETFVPGEPVSGEVYIVGGDNAQEFERIYLSVVASYRHEDVTHSYDLASYDVVRERISVGPGENRTVPFSFTLPYATPLSLGHGRVYLKTGLDIAGAIDPSDTDEIRVVPHPLQQVVLDAAASLGFRLYQVENEYNPRKGAPHPFVQQLEFRPHGRYAGHVEELELIFKLGEDALEVLVELDRRARSLTGLLESAMEMNERFDSLRVTPADARSGAVEGMLAGLIESHTR